MPVADVVLAELPAEQNGLALTKRREIDQPLVDVLHLRAVLVDLVDRASELTRDALDLGRAVGERRGRDAAAVAPDVPLELLLALERGDVLAPQFDHALD